MATISIGDLRHRVELQVLATTRDSIGGLVEGWSTLLSVWALVAPMSASEQWRRQQMQSAANWKITIRYRTGIVPQMRVLFGTRVFQVRGIVNADRVKRFLELACEELSVTEATNLFGDTPPPTWVLYPRLDIDPLNDRVWNGVAVISPLSSFISCIRALPPAYYTKADGTLTSFDGNVLRYGTNGLLVEEVRTNVVLRSQTFDNAYWTKDLLTVAADATIAPDGTPTADLLTESNTNGFHRVYVLGAPLLTGIIAYSVIAKSHGRSWMQLYLNDAGGGASRWANFNVATGAIGNSANGVTLTIQALANGWYRCTIVAAITSNPANNFEIFTIDSDQNTAAPQYAGDGVSGIYWWADQLEAGAFATSYMPTTTAAVTRAADLDSFTIPSGVGHLVFIFDDDSTQQVAISPGAYAIPTSLNRPYIKRIGGLA